MKYRVLTSFVFLTIIFGHAFAQNRSDLDGLDEKVRRHFEKTMPGWKHQRVEPLMNGENVLIEVWSSPNRGVKVSILSHKSAEDAREFLQRNSKYYQNKETLIGFGDEAYAYSYRSDVAFRRGKFTVYVSTIADVESDADAQSLTQSQRFDREKSEMQRLSREFAKQMVSALDAP